MNPASNVPIRIAVVDDDPIFRELTCAIVSSRAEYIAIPVASGDKLFEILRRFSVRCILLDYNLGTENGFSIKKNLDVMFSDAPPVIMLTGDGRERTAIEAFRLGVNDYLPKLAMGPETLLSMISSVVRNEHARLEAKAEYIRLQQAVLMDPVTGLSGRAALDERLGQLTQLGREDRRAFTIVTIQLLEYRSIVEHYGSAMAEQALQAFAEKLKEVRQASDMCGRHSEGTFLIIKQFRSDPAAVDDVCRRLSEFLSFTTETPFATLRLSARVAITVCGSNTPSELDQWSRLAGSSKTMSQPKELPSVQWSGTCDHPGVSCSAETVIDTLPLLRTHLPAWVYAPS